MLTHFLATLTQLFARIWCEISFRGANFGMFYVQLFQAGLRVNFEFGQEYASEKNGTIILIKLSELAILCVRSGEFMVFPTLMHLDSRAVIKVVRYGLTIQCWPDAHTVELVEQQIARQEQREQ